MKQENTTAIIDGQRYYKVLKDGHSFHGGKMKWSLPNGGPGEWHEVQGDLIMCRRAIHLTRTPANWFDPGARVYAVEVAGAVTKGDGDKIAVRRCRLLRELDETELAEHGIFLSGKHEVQDGLARAYGSATVWAYYNATVLAFDNTVVQAYDSARVEAYDNATVEAYDRSTVQAYGRTTVRAYYCATVTLWQDQPSVQLEHRAVSIDRRSRKPVMATAEEVTG